MKSKTLVIVGLIAVFVVLVGYALLGELRRDRELLAESITGVVEIKLELFAEGVADVVKTDRLALFLVDPATQEVVALKFETPLVPPQNIRIGKADARTDKPLTGAYLLVGITDKDGEVFKVTPGELYGRTAQPVKIGDQQVKLVLDQAFRGSLTNAPGGPTMAGPAGGQYGGGAGPAPGGGGGGPMVAEGAPEDPARTIRGTVRVAAALAKNVTPQDRLIVMLFDPQAGRPAAIKIIPHTLLPQEFSIALPPGAAPNPAGYSLRIITDKDNSPFNAAPGELVGRSPNLVPLGTTGVDFVLDQPYVR
jgi:hypothetical protein